MKNIKIFSGAIFVIMLLIQTGCNDDPVAPTSEKEEEAIASATIGPEGGEIVADEFTLSIPPSSFNTSAEIKVFASSTDKPFGENNASKSYRLEGLPSDYSKPLKVSIKYSNDAVSNQNFLVVGEEYLSSGEFSYTLLESTDSSGILVGYLPLSNHSQSTIALPKPLTDGKFVIDISVITGYATYISSQGHFKIFIPLTYVGSAQLVSEYLEEAYQKILDLGFSYEVRTNWPLNITFRSLKDKSGKFIDALTTTSKLGDNYGYIEFNENLFNDHEQLHVTVGHEYFHVVQSFYDTRSYLVFGGKGVSAPPHHWVNEAFGAWIEEKFTDINNYVPNVRSNENKIAPLEGMYYGIHYGGADPIKYGYGMSAVAKYVIDKYGESVLLKVYEDIKNGKHFIDAFCRTSPESPVEWWEDFLKEYILSNIYNDVGRGTWNSNLSGEFKISSVSDKFATYTESYEYLSGKIYRILPIYSEINPKSQLTFNISGASRGYLTLFKFDRSGIEYLASDYNEVIVKDIRTLTDNKKRLYAIVSNNRYSVLSSTNKQITLEIKVEEESQNVLDFNRCGFGFSFNGIIKETTPDGTSEDERSLDWNWYIYNASGSFSGNTFTGSFNERSGEFVGTITATLNDEHTMITNFVYTFEYRPNETTVANYFVSGKDLPSKLLDPSDYRFGLSFDSEVCSHLLDVKYKYTDVSSTPITKELVDYSCDEYSTIGISFKKE